MSCDLLRFNEFRLKADIVCIIRIGAAVMLLVVKTIKTWLTLDIWWHILCER